MSSSKIEQLENQLRPLYMEHSKDLLFHGWHHIAFVRKKSLEFAETINADKLIVEAAALTHDLNFIVRPNSGSEEGKGLRQEILSKAGFSQDEIDRIESVVMESHTANRNEKITSEGMALSDADTVFRALPITPILFASRFMMQNKIDISKWAHKVTSEQNKLMNSGIYFYTELAKTKYLEWAKDNLKLCNDALDCLEDKDVQEMLKIARDLNVL